MKSKKEISELIINELDEIARNYDHYEFGLPFFNADEVLKMDSCVERGLDEHAQTLAKEVVDLLWEKTESASYEQADVLSDAINLIKQKFDLK